MNLYGFAGGDPVTYRDPCGLCPERPWECESIRKEKARIEASDKGLETPAIDPIAIAADVATGGALTVEKGGAKALAKGLTRWGWTRGGKAPCCGPPVVSRRHSFGCRGNRSYR